MGLLSFVKEAGEKIWDAVSGSSKEDQADKLKKHIDSLNLPGAEKGQYCRSGRWYRDGNGRCRFTGR